MSEKRERRLRGAPASPSVAAGRILFVGQKAPEKSRRILPYEVPHEQARFLSAIQQVDAHLIELQAHFVAEHNATSLILEAFRLMLQDPLLLDGTQRRIEHDLWCAEAALRLTQDEISKSFDAIDDEYLRAKKSEVDSLIERIIRHLQDQVHTPISLQDAILVAHEFSPVDIVSYSKSGARGFISEGGGPLSHAVIVARALGFPGVVAATQSFSLVAEGEEALVDGLRGEIVLSPSASTRAEYEGRRARFLATEKALLQNREESATTLDGVSITLRGNIEMLEELPGLSLYGAKGIGLLRTEFSFLYRKDLPSEEEQLAFAKEVLRNVSPEPTTFRTLDLGGDKLLEQGIRITDEPLSPRLRAIRLCLQHPALFRTQLRALLRASLQGPVRLLLPMITGLAELRAAKAMIASVAQELTQEGYPLPPIPIGVMIETPSAVIMSEALAKEADFFCIGSNDLIQYTLAIDRSEEIASAYYRPHHPAIIRMLAMIAASTKPTQTPLSICGEMAADPLYTTLLLGLGIKELSMSPSAIPAVKQVIRATTMQESLALAQRALQCDTAPEIEALLRSFIKGTLS